MTSPNNSSLEISAILQDSSQGATLRAEEVFPALYDELRKRAHNLLRRERPGHSLQTTALINETYIKLREQRHFEWENRDHFFAICALLMRRILVDYAKARYRAKRGGRADHVPIHGLALAIEQEADVDLLKLDDALARLAEIDPQQARIVELRYFSGFSIEETAAVLAVSPSTVKRDWRAAKAWLHNELTD